MYCDATRTCYECSYISSGYCDALGDDCCSASFLQQCGDLYQCTAPPKIAQSLAKTTSFLSSVMVTISHLHQIEPSAAGGVDSEDHGLLLQFMTHAQDLLARQTNLSQWATVSNTCVALVDQLLPLDYQGAYYCNKMVSQCGYDEHNWYWHCNYTNQRCTWNANHK